MCDACRVSGRVRGNVAAWAAAAAVALLGIASLVVPSPAGATAPWSGSPTATGKEQVSSLIVQYAPGIDAGKVRGPVRGADRVTPSVRASLRVGPALGLNMWRVDFDRPVSMRVALRTCRQLAAHRDILAAEPDMSVSTARTALQVPRPDVTGFEFGL